MTNSLTTTVGRTLSELGHSSAVSDLAGLKSGLVLVSGPIASGKTTTLSGLATEATNVFSRVAMEILFSSSSENIGVGQYTLPASEYRWTFKGRNLDSLNLARKYCLQNAAHLLDVADVVFFDDIRRPETARIATHLAESGTLVFASIHNTGEPRDAVRCFNGLLSELHPGSDTSSLIPAIVHQKILRNGSTPKMVSDVVSL